MSGISKILYCLVLTLICVGIIYSTPVQAQDPQGNLDYYYVQCGTDTSNVITVRVRYNIDNTGSNQVAGFAFPCLITVTNSALVIMDTSIATVFAGSGAGGFALKITNTDGTTVPGGDDPTTSPIHFVAGAIDFGAGVTGDNLYASLRITRSDTCTIIIDTLTSGASAPSMVTTLAAEYTPGWGSSTNPNPGGDSCVVTAVSDVKSGTTALPNVFELSQNFPNPFNATTVIQFALPEASMVRLEVFNVLGQRVVTLVDEELAAGYKQVIWDGRNQRGDQVTSGVYFYRVQAGEKFTELKKMLLVK
jgi:hypothetical protein